MTKWSSFIKNLGTAGPPTFQGIRALGFALITDFPTQLSKYLRVDAAQTFSNGEKTQGRANLGVVIGSDVQAYNLALASIAALATVADRMIYTTGPNVYAATPLTTFARSILDDTDATGVKTTIGLQNVDNTSDASKPVSTAQQTALNLKANLTAVTITKEFVSAPQAITSGGLLTIPHGLGVPPKFIAPALVCVTADAGYSVNDVIPANLQSSSSASDNMGASFEYSGATNILVRFGSLATVFNTINKTTGATVFLANANWRLVLKAYA